jgi:uncharacterized protein YjbI with pentapeptide repeats
VVQDASEVLLQRVSGKEGFSAEALDEAARLLQRLAVSGHVTREPEYRRILRNKLSYWAAQLRMTTGSYIEAPPLLPAGKGSGLPQEDATKFTARLRKTEELGEVEVQGASLDANKRYLSRLTVLNAFLLRCEFLRLNIAETMALAATSFVGGQLANVTAAQFNAADARFIGTKISKLRAKGANFQNVRMPYTEIHGGELVDAVFDFSKLGGEGDIDQGDRDDIANYGIDEKGTGATRFVGVDLRGASFAGTGSLKGTTFENCNLEGARFSGSYLAGAIFRDCDFLGDEFNDSYDREYADLQDSRPGEHPDPRVSREPDEPAMEALTERE